MQRHLASLLRWFRSHEPAVQLAVLLVGVSAWIFFELADEVLEGETQAFDEPVLKGLRDPGDDKRPVGPPWLAEVARDVTALGGWAVLVLVTLAACGFLVLGRRYVLALAVLLAVVGGTLATFGLKSIFARPRPAVVPPLVHVTSASFPSGHSMMSAVVYLTLGSLLATIVPQRRLKVYVFAVAVTLTVLVGVSRVYLGVHYPTDVLAGWAAGVAWSAAARLVVRRFHQGKAVEGTAGNPDQMLKLQDSTRTGAASQQ